MNFKQPTSWRSKSHLSIPLIYLVVGSLYILFSDMLVSKLITLDNIVLIGTIKGLGFVTTTAALLFILLARENRLRTGSEKFFRTLVDSMEDAVFVLDVPSREIVYANKAASRIFGYTNDQLKGLNTRDLHVSEEHYHQFKIRGQQSLGQGKPFYTEFQMKRADGTAFPTSHIVCLMQADSDHTLALSVVRDYTLVKESEEKFREQETLLHEIAANLREVFWISNVDKSSLLYVSPAYVEVWGQDPAELFRNPMKFLESIVPEDREWVKHKIDEQTKGNYDVQYRIRKPGGEIRWIWDRATPIADEAGKIYRIVGIAEDITEFKQKEEEFLHASKMEYMGQVASGITHDFRNYLMVVLLNAELLEAKVTEWSARELLDNVARAATEANKLSERLLAFSRRQSLQAVTVNINNVIKELLPLLKPLLTYKIDLVTNLSPELPDCYLDRSNLESSVINIITNARDAMPDGGTITVSTTTEVRQLDTGEEAQFVALHISDTGHGIAQENILRIFEPYFSTKAPGKGTGLGLSMVHGFVLQSGGDIAVESMTQEGTTFHLYFPRYRESISTEQPRVKLA